MTTIEALAAWSDESRRRFWSRVRKTDGCWEWLGGKTVYGYGQYAVGIPGLTQRAHKLSWESVNGPVPSGLVLDHLCRNRMCVRPDHLEAVTNRENVLRGVGISASNAKKTHCKRGHELEPPKDGPGSRTPCEACAQIRYEERLIRGRNLRGAVVCGHPTRNGKTCTKRIAIGAKCVHHDVWNTGQKEVT